VQWNDDSFAYATIRKIHNHSMIFLCSAWTYPLTLMYIGLGNSVDAVEYVVDSSRESQTRANIIDLLAGGKLGSTPSQSTGGAKKKQGKLVKILKIPKM